MLKPVRSTNGRPGAPSNKGKTRVEKRKCYRCDRTGHLANKCTYATKADGSAPNPRPSKPLNQLEETSAEDDVVDTGIIDVSMLD